jgi:hypothetical protein
MSETVLDRLFVRLAEALAYNANAHVAPAALLWPDEDSQWSPVVDRIRAFIQLRSEYCIACVLAVVWGIISVSVARS